MKIGDDDLKKTIGTGEAMRARVHPDNVRDVLLLPADDKPLWDTTVQQLAQTDDQAATAPSRASDVTVIDWHDVARGLRSALAESGETLTWRVLARVFCGAIEQSLVGLPRVPKECAPNAISLLDVEHLMRYQTLRDEGA